MVSEKKMNENRKTKIGIMGGTFNPVHIGHLMLAQTALSQFQLDKIWFMPNNKPDYKPTMELLSASARIEMLQLAIEDNPDFEVSTFEIDRGGYTYTYETLDLLKKEYSNQAYYFILGGDSLFAFTKWRCPEAIAQNCVILAAPRHQTSREDTEKQILLLNKQFNASIFQLDCPNLEISSNMIREKVKKKLSIRYFVPEKVYNYIMSHKLYQK